MAVDPTLHRAAGRKWPRGMMPLVALFFSLLPAPWLRAADPAAPPPSPLPMWPAGEWRKQLEMPLPTPEGRAETARLLRDLAAADFSTRDKASRELEARGPDAFPGLREAVAASRDPELAARAGVVLASYPSIPPNVPANVTAAVRNYYARRRKYLEQRASNPGARFEPLSGFKAPAADGLSREMFRDLVLDGENEPAIRIALDSHTALSGPYRARRAISEGRLGDAVSLLVSAPDGESLEDLATLLALRAGPGFDPEKQLAPLSLSPAQKQTATALLWRAAGDYARAAETLSPARYNEWRPDRRLLIETGEYARLAALLDSQRQDRRFDTRMALAYHLTGNTGRITELFAETADIPVFAGLQRATLIQLGRVEEAIEQARNTPGGEETAFYLLCSQLRIREALALLPDPKRTSLQVPEQLMRLGLNQTALKLLKAIKPDSITNSSSVQFAFLLARDLDAAGDRAAAAQLRGSVLDRLAEVDAEFTKLLREQRQLTATRDFFSPASLDPRQQSSLELDVMNVTFRIRELERILDQVGFWGDPALPDLAAQTEAGIWCRHILDKEQLPLKVRHAMAARIVRGELTDAECEALVGITLHAMDPVGVWYSPESMLEVAARRFHRLKRDDLAQQLVSQWHLKTRDPSCFQVLGDIALEQGLSAQAADYYRRAAVMNLTDPTLMYRLGWALSRQPETRQAGEQLKAFVPFLILSNYDQAVAVAQWMRRLESPQAGDAWFESFTRHYSRMTDDRLGYSLLIARRAAEAKADYAQALDLQTKILFSPPDLPEGEEYVPSSFATWHRLRALDALARRDLPVLADALTRELDYAPPDLDTLEKMLPALNAANSAAAQKIFNVAWTRLKAVVDDYPDATPYRSQLQRLEKLR